MGVKKRDQRGCRICQERDGRARQIPKDSDRFANARVSLTTAPFGVVSGLFPITASSAPFNALDVAKRASVSTRSVRSSRAD